MNLYKSSWRGVGELQGVGYPYDYDYNDISMDNALKRILENVKYHTIVASLTDSQTGGADCLIANGFKKVGKGAGNKSITNPNSGNQIYLFVKFLNKRKAK